jgi:hypothetical protein
MPGVQVDLGAIRSGADSPVNSAAVSGTGGVIRHEFFPLNSGQRWPVSALGAGQAAGRVAERLNMARGSSWLARVPAD